MSKKDILDEYQERLSSNVKTSGGCEETWRAAQETREAKQVRSKRRSFLRRAVGSGFLAAIPFIGSSGSASAASHSPTREEIAELARNARSEYSSPEAIVGAIANHGESTLETVQEETNLGFDLNKLSDTGFIQKHTVPASQLSDRPESVVVFGSVDGEGNPYTMIQYTHRLPNNERYGDSRFVFVTIPQWEKSYAATQPVRQTESSVHKHGNSNGKSYRSTEYITAAEIGSPSPQGCVMWFCNFGCTHPSCDYWDCATIRIECYGNTCSQYVEDQCYSCEWDQRVTCNDNPCGKYC